MSQTEGVCSDIFKATQDIAAQAALRAQERLQKVREPPPLPAQGSSSDVPLIPARSSGISQKAPDIPPKRFAANNNNNNNVPPPLPQKPQARSETNNGLYAQTSAAAAPRVDFLPQVPSRNPPPAPQRNGNLNGQLDGRAPNQPSGIMSPVEDTSSEDALRGIESGLRNMERAMQEQMNLRSLETSGGEANKFNIPEFRAGLRNIGSMSSFEGLTPPQYMMPPNVNGGGVVVPQGMSRTASGGLERGLSMDHMSQLRGLEQNAKLASRNIAEELKMKATPPVDAGANKPRPIEQHMRSLDRSLPLELQYSRNHRQQQLQQQQLLLQQQLVSKVMNAPDPNRHMDMLNQFINQRTNVMPPNNMVVGGGAGGVPGGVVGPQVVNPAAREDLKMRRRSSHDENQILHQTNAPPGIETMLFRSLIYFYQFTF